MAELIEEARSAAEPTPTIPEPEYYDPFDRTQVEAIAEAKARALMGDRVESLEQTINVLARKEAQMVARDMIDKMAAHESIGGLSDPGKERALSLGEAYMYQGLEGAQALARAVQETKDFERSLMEAGAEEYRARLAAAAGASPEPAAGSGAAITPVDPSTLPGTPYQQAARATLARIRA
jgi:hypothetical protein